MSKQVTLCYLRLKILGGKVVRWKGGLDVDETSEGYVVSIPGDVHGLRFNLDGLQTDQDGNILSDPYYWLEIQ
jgi:hypothetical protein